MALPADLEESVSHHIGAGRFSGTWGTPFGKGRGVRSTLLQVSDEYFMWNMTPETSKCKSADLSRCVLTALYLRSKTPPYPPPLRPPRTYFVSLDKTNHSSAEVLISGTLRGGGGPRAVDAQFVRSIKQALSAFACLLATSAPNRIRSVKQVLPA